MSRPVGTQLIIERLDDEGVIERQCTKCLEWWPADSEFYKKNDRGTGLLTHCIGCRRDYWRERQVRLKEVGHV